MFKGLSMVLWVATTTMVVACGEETEPHPGYADPCDSLMGGVLGCPPRSPATGTGLPTIVETCQKLVSCGILAGEFLTPASSKSCSTSEDCSSGQQCLNTSNGNRCHTSYLDFEWCMARFSAGGNNPCISSQSFSNQQIESAMSCIWATPCNSLGLLFDKKRTSSSSRPELDKYTCPNGEDHIWTATICDHGLLRY